MNSLLGDLRYALRRFRSRLGFTLIAVISLGLGIGANTAAFSLINAIVLRKTPLPHPERVAEVWYANDGKVSAPFSYPDYKDLREAGRDVFSQFSISQLGVVSRDMGDHVQTLITELVNGDFFPLLGVRPQIGRLLGPSDDVTPGGHPVVVLSYNYWRRAFASDPNVVGQTMRLSGRQLTIVGVAPKGVEGLLPGLAPALFVSVQMINQLQPTTRDELAARGNHSEFARVRLADGKSMADVRLVLDRFSKDMKRDHPDYWNEHMALTAIPLTQVAVSPLVDKMV